MKASTIWTMAKSGRLRTLGSLGRLAASYYETCFLASAARAGVLKLLAQDLRSLDELAERLGIDAAGHEALIDWLELGVSTGCIKHTEDGYALKSHLANELADPENDDAMALLEEMTGLHHALVMETPARLAERRLLTLADQEGRVIARSSRVLEPVVREAVAEQVGEQGALRLLEIGCGSGTHIRFAAQRNPDLTALGLELQPEVAELAKNNLAKWGLSGRVEVEACDVRERAAEPTFDLVTLHNNIYYFSVDKRVALLEHVRGFLKKGGTLLLTTGCRGGSPAMVALSLWGGMTVDCGPLPEPETLLEQMRQAGYHDVSSRNLLAPVDAFCSFVGTAS